MAAVIAYNTAQKQCSVRLLHALFCAALNAGTAMQACCSQGSQVTDRTPAHVSQACPPLKL